MGRGQIVRTYAELATALQLPPDARVTAIAVDDAMREATVYIDAPWLEPVPDGMESPVLEVSFHPQVEQYGGYAKGGSVPDVAGQDVRQSF